MFSFIFPRRLEEWKKRAEKFRRPSKNSGKVGRMEEVAEEENNLNSEHYKISRIRWKNGRSIRYGRREINIFYHFPQKIRRMEEERQKNSEDLPKTLEKLEEWKKLWKKIII
jgi:hypothetical protein